jgi:putative ABC transport system permease protein
VEVKDKPIANRGEAPSAERFAISPGYLETMKIPLLRGRTLTGQDHQKSLPVVLVNRTFAERIWPGEDPLGKQIHIGEPERPWRTVVGVVGDVRHRGLNVPFAMQFYMPFQQWFDTSLSVVARTAKEPSAVVKDVQRAIWSVDAKQPISQVSTMEEVIGATVAEKQFALQLVEFFAIAALFLAATGVYGVMAFSVTSRFQEIGLRMALGATRTRVLALILRNGFILASAGTAIGIAGSFLFLRFLKSLLFQVSPYDVPILAVAVAILFSVALIASAIPALRAARLDPVTVLHHE